MTELTSERLRLRHFRDDDTDAYARMLADPEAVRFLGHGPLPRHEAWRQMAMLMGHWTLRGFGMWAVEERTRGELVGRVGFHQPEGWPGFEIGWLVEPSRWGRGYATEAARTCLDWARAHREEERVISLIHPENLASIAVAEKLGERFERRHELFGVEVSIYGRELRP